ncbi:MAG: adenylate/guanylate cyclase domain-containing protein [Marmoricola sp.]
MAEPVDHKRLIDLLEAYLLGEEPSLTGHQLADDVGIPFETARERWRSLGFTAVDEHVPAFTHADLEALRLTQRLSDLGFVDPDDEAALVRTLGRSFARLAEWQMRLLARMIDVDEMSVDELAALMDEVTPAVEALQNYVWRRHTLAVAARLLLAADRDDEEVTDELDSEEGDGVVMGVGFADIVNYTRQSRSLSRKELSQLIDNFESRALEIITTHDGRIIKTIGDEILFVADEPDAIARIGLELVEERLRDEDFPELRVGLAWGPALARLGDVLGPVVNVSSRLTSTSRPGRVLIDRNLAEELEDSEDFKLKRLRRTSVRGYRKLEPWSLRRPADQDPEISQDGALPGPASSFINEQAKGLFRGRDEPDPGAEGSSGGEDVD